MAQFEGIILFQKYGPRDHTFPKSMVPQDRLHLSLKLVLNLTLVSSADVLELTLRASARGPSLNSANTVVEVSGAASQSISIEFGPGST